MDSASNCIAAFSLDWEQLGCFGHNLELGSDEVYPNLYNELFVNAIPLLRSSIVAGKKCRDLRMKQDKRNSKYVSTT